jgi:hypothetical protein
MVGRTRMATDPRRTLLQQAGGHGDTARTVADLTRMPTPTSISTKKAVIWGGVIGLAYPIGSFILGAVLNRLFPRGIGIVNGLFEPLRVIRRLIEGLHPIDHPIMQLFCATARNAQGIVTETSFGCEIIFYVIEIGLICMLLGILIGWLATIVARYGKKSAHS